MCVCSSGFYSNGFQLSQNKLQISFGTKNPTRRSIWIKPVREDCRQVFITSFKGQKHTDSWWFDCSARLGTHTWLPLLTKHTYVYVKALESDVLSALCAASNRNLSAERSRTFIRRYPNTYISNKALGPLFHLRPHIAARAGMSFWRRLAALSFILRWKIVWR